MELKNFNVIDILNKYIENKSIDYWRINSFFINKNNVYVQSNFRIESKLNSQRNEHLITINKSNKEILSESSFLVSHDILKEDFDLLLQKALINLKYSKIKLYELPKKEDLEVNDKSIDYLGFSDKKTREFLENNNLVDYIKTQLNSTEKVLKESQTDEIRFNLNYLELLTELKDIFLLTSTNISKQQKKESIYLEFVVTAINKKNSEEKEFIVYHKIVDFFNFDFISFLDDTIRKAKDSFYAQKSKTIKTDVILSNKAILDFFLPDLTSNSVIGHCSSQLKFMNMSDYDVGKEIFTSKKDKLTIISNPFYNDSSTTAFDVQGITSKKITLIKDNIVENLFGNKQFTSYLGIKPTGALGVLEVGLGELSYDKLTKGDLIEIESFSSFVPDIVSGDFSAEIRLAYLYKNGEKIPIKGGLFSANIFTILSNCSLSKESLREVGYFGPKHIKFYDCKITGF